MFVEKVQYTRTNQNSCEWPYTFSPHWSCSRRLLVCLGGQNAPPPPQPCRELWICVLNLATKERYLSKPAVLFYRAVSLRRLGLGLENRNRDIEKVKGHCRESRKPRSVNGGRSAGWAICPPSPACHFHGNGLFMSLFPFSSLYFHFLAIVLALLPIHTFCCIFLCMCTLFFVRAGYSHYLTFFLRIGTFSSLLHCLLQSIRTTTASETFHKGICCTKFKVFRGSDDCLKQPEAVKKVRMHREKIPKTLKYAGNTWSSEKKVWIGRITKLSKMCQWPIVWNRCWITCSWKKCPKKTEKFLCKWRRTCVCAGNRENVEQWKKTWMKEKTWHAAVSAQTHINMHMCSEAVVRMGWNNLEQAEKRANVEIGRNNLSREKYEAWNAQQKHRAVR